MSIDSLFETGSGKPCTAASAARGRKKRFKTRFASSQSPLSSGAFKKSAIRPLPCSSFPKNVNHLFRVFSGAKRKRFLDSERKGALRIAGSTDESFRRPKLELSVRYVSLTLLLCMSEARRVFGTAPTAALPLTAAAGVWVVAIRNVTARISGSGARG